MRLDAKGYNLIELMVVVAVLGVLFSIAIPNYYAMKNRALEALTEANMYDFQIAVVNFSVDHQGLYPDPSQDAEVRANMSGGEYPENPFTDAREPWVWGPPGGPPGTIGCVPGPNGYAKGFEIWGMGTSGPLKLVLRNL